MKTACLIIGVAALVTACPDEWVNPCIIVGSQSDLNPKNERWCGTSSAGYIGQVGNSGTGSHNYVNDWGDALGLFDSQLNIQSYNGQKASGSNKDTWTYNGNKHNQLYSSSSTHVYLQECSNACVNHPTCTSFAFEGTEHAKNDEARWDDHAAGDVGQTGSSKTTQVLRGKCYLYKYCDVNTLITMDNRKQWWLGVRSQGAYDGTHAICQKKAQLDDACKSSNSCVKDCPAGEFFTTDASGKNTCTSCPPGQFKTGRNTANACTPHSSSQCGAGEYLKTAGTRFVDNDCRTHSPVCSNTAFQSQAPTANQDRQCTACRVCPAGTEIETGCLKRDPWLGITYRSTSTGRSTGAISITQTGDITDRVVVVHDVNKKKIACGKLQNDPWLGKTWTSSNGSASGTISTIQTGGVENKVVVVHGPDGSKIACGKLTPSGSTFTATLSKMPGYTGNTTVAGSFTLAQSQIDVTGSYTMTGLPSGTGMYHVHSGTSCSSVGGHYLNNLDIATITKIPGYSGNLDVKGTFRFKQVASTVRGSYVLEGLPASAEGMIHVHSGTSCSSPGAHYINDGTASEQVPHTHRRLSEAGHPSVSVSAAGQNWDGNTKCNPCIATQTFASNENTAVCRPVTPCKIGEHVTTAGTATADQVCSPCSQSLHYTETEGTVSCSFTVDNYVRAVYLDGEDVTSQVSGNLHHWPTKKTLTFSSLKRSLAVRCDDAESGCVNGGFAMKCTVSNGVTGPGASWAMDSSNRTIWKVASSSSFNDVPAADASGRQWFDKDYIMGQRFKTPRAGSTRYADSIIGVEDMCAGEGDSQYNNKMWFRFTGIPDAPTIPKNSEFLNNVDCAWRCKPGFVSKNAKCDTLAGTEIVQQVPGKNVLRVWGNKCTIHGAWSSWGTLEACSVTACGSTGTRTRRRTCTNPAPQHGGDGCSGSDTDSSMVCSTAPCPLVTYAEDAKHIDGGGWIKFNWNNGVDYPDSADPFGEEQCDSSATICRGRIPKDAQPTKLLVKKDANTWAYFNFDGSTKSNTILAAMRDHQIGCSKSGNWAPAGRSGSMNNCISHGNCNVFAYTDGSFSCDGHGWTQPAGQWETILDDDGHWCQAAWKMGATMNSGIKDDYGYIGNGCDRRGPGGALYYKV